MRVCGSHMVLCAMQAELGDRDDKAHQGSSKQQHGAFIWQPDSAVIAAMPLCNAGELASCTPSSLWPLICIPFVPLGHFLAWPMNSTCVNACLVPHPIHL
jgi:hypothetical protein